ncbi:MAG: glucose-6-phosphate isomerase [Planctomycetota bacterium]|nr:MAG: glucose-6-phosphate isomerase [Planctomycetota bacterium]
MDYQLRSRRTRLEAGGLSFAAMTSTVRIEDPSIAYSTERSLGVGGVSAADLEAAAPAARAAADAFAALVESGRAVGLDEPVLWPRLGEGDPGPLEAVRSWAERVRRADTVVSVGIGGSYLGNRVLRDALLGPGWNERDREGRGDRPELRFAGYHLDPAELAALVDLFASRSARGPQRVELLAISKSGTTVETLATTLVLREALGQLPGVEVRLAALTAPGTPLAELAAERGEVLPFPEGIGGRWSVLSPVGLATAAASGVDVDALLDGARAVRSVLLSAGGELDRNPALRYAVVHRLHAQRGRSGAVFMPYAERLRCVSEWYVQLLAESLGKARDRQGRRVHTGRTPIVAVGTTDMHAQTQQHQEGARDKTVTTLDVLDWGAAEALRVPELPAAGRLAGRRVSELNRYAREANEVALAGDDRPSDSFLLGRLDERTLGGLLYLLMASVAYEGELLDVCAYDQPGVEAYKRVLRERLGTQPA